MTVGLRIVAIALLVAAPAFGQDVSVRAYLSANQVGINRQFVLNVEISGTQQVDSDPTLPDMDEFSTFLSSSTSTSMQIVNNRTTVSITLQYRFQAIKEGTFEIGAVEVRAGGETHTTEPLTISITSSPPPTQPGAARTTGEVEIAPEDLFVTAEVSNRIVYENEPVFVTYRIYTRLNVSSYSVLRLPSTAGFWVEEFELPASPRVEQVVRDGVQYATAVIRRVALFPTGPGDKTVEPLSIEAQVQVQRRSRDLFDDFFRSPFGTRVPVVVASEPVGIRVRALPEEGRPPNFSGLVGEFDVTATLDKTNMETNEAATYRVRVEGVGNVRTVPEPAIDFPTGFEVYPPEVTEQLDRVGNSVRGNKAYEYVLVPRTPGSHTIPGVELSYFDVGSSTYTTVTTPPITLEVTGAAVEGPTTAGRTRGSIEQLREDIRFIRIATPKFRPRDRSLFTLPEFWIVFLVPLVVVGGAWSFRRHRDRLEGDIAYARRRRASRVAKKRLARSRALRSPDEQREFYAEVARALQGFLGDKLNIAAAGLIRDDVSAALSQCGVERATVDEYLACIDVCDRQRFAPTEPNVATMNEFLERAERAMTDLDQGLAR
ncbi:MAG: protein BatD [Gemmatimonadota bacterium]|nr:MAG: protein BatD [Gemmatimonadota bacterium]